MNSKDNLIIAWLILLTILVMFTCLMIDRDIDAINKTVSYLVEQQKATDSKVDTLLNSQSDTDKRLADIEEKQRDIQESIAVTNGHIDSIQTQVDTHTEQIKAIPTPKAVEKVPLQENNKPKYMLTEKEIQMIASLVYLEAGAQNTVCKRAVVSVVINRMIRYKKTAYQIIYEPGVFSVANNVTRTTPSQSCIDAVRYVIKNGTTIPRNVLAFRNRHYHTFGKPYKKIDGVYFTCV